VAARSGHPGGRLAGPEPSAGHAQSELPDDEHGRRAHPGRTGRRDRRPAGRRRHDPGASATVARIAEPARWAGDRRGAQRRGAGGGAAGLPALRRLRLQHRDLSGFLAGDAGRLPAGQPDRLLRAVRGGDGIPGPGGRDPLAGGGRVPARPADQGRLRGVGADDARLDRALLRRSRLGDLRPDPARRSGGHAHRFGHPVGASPDAHPERDRALSHPRGGAGGAGGDRRQLAVAARRRGRGPGRRGADTVGRPAGTSSAAAGTGGRTGSSGGGRLGRSPRPGPRHRRRVAGRIAAPGR